MSSLLRLFRKLFGVVEEEEGEEARARREEIEEYGVKEYPEVAGKLIGVVGVKGGAGKSTIATSLATVLGVVRGVLVVDLDIYNSTSSSVLIQSLLEGHDELSRINNYIDSMNLLLYIVEYHGRADKLLGVPVKDIEVPEHLVEYLRQKYLRAGSIRVLPGKPVDSSMYRKLLWKLYAIKKDILDDAVETFITVIRDKATRLMVPVVFDFPPLVYKKAKLHKSFLSYMDELVVVSSPEPESLHGLLASIEDVKDKVSLFILNRAPTREVCEEQVEVCEIFLQVHRRVRAEFHATRICSIPYDLSWKEAFDSRLTLVLFTKSRATEKFLKCMKELYI